TNSIPGVPKEEESYHPVESRTFSRAQSYGMGASKSPGVKVSKVTRMGYKTSMAAAPMLKGSIWGMSPAQSSSGGSGAYSPSDRISIRLPSSSDTRTSVVMLPSLYDVTAVCVSPPSISGEQASASHNAVSSASLAS